MSSEEPDTAYFRIWVVPLPHVKVKTVCAVGSKAPDPQAIGSKADADTVTCKVLNGIQHQVLLKDDAAAKRH